VPEESPVRTSRRSALLLQGSMTKRCSSPFTLRFSADTKIDYAFSTNRFHFYNYAPRTVSRAIYQRSLSRSCECFHLQ
jgi:hypothetical protein